MSSGLDSIALAVAHLEEQRELQDKQAIAQTFAKSSRTPSPTQPPPVPPRSLPMPPARVVSIDEAPSAVSNNSDVSGTFAFILADPITWLSKIQDRPPLQAPENTIHKVETGDVLCGRGGETNHHKGNIQYRALVKAFQPLYVRAKRREKPMIAQCIVYSVRQVGGRFLKKVNDKEWKDVGNTKAREKTSQALREGAPELRGDSAPQQQQKQQHHVQHHQLPPPPHVAPHALPMPYHPPAQMTSMEATLLSAFLTPLQQALGRPVVVTPTTTHQGPPPPTLASEKASQKKRRAVMISDHNSDSDSVDSNGQRGPRLKRFKKRVEQESSLSS